MILKKAREWKIDPSVKQRQSQGGGPAEGHARRCQGHPNQQRDKQCGRWACVGSNYCKFHGGKQPSTNTKRMANYYSRRAGPTLKARLEELKDTNPEERHSLAGEIDLARIVAERAVAIYEATVLNDEGTPNLKALATNSVRAALSHVSDLVAKAAKVHSVSNSVIELEHIDYIMAQVIRAIHDGCDDDEELEKRITDRVTAIRLPKGNREMDADAQAEQIRQALLNIDDTVG